MKSLTYIVLVLMLLSAEVTVYAQACTGGQIYTKEAFTHGRFEVKMQSAEGNGVVSSFFLYNLDLNCNWPAENNEIDIEMTGNKDSLYFTTHYPGPWYYGDVYEPSFNPHDTMVEYAFEWTPGVVKWFVEGQLVYTQNQPFVSQLIHPMRIMMNLWAANAVSWVGPWDPSIMPVQSEYELVRYYSYTPGSGNSGSGNNFTFQWEDNFNSLDTSRWEVEQNGGFNGNYCTFKGSSVEFTSGKLILKMEDPAQNPPTIPVTFSVNTASMNLNGGDVINLAGPFNGWCGNCTPMTKIGDVWTKTLYLPAGEHEYVFVRNFWQETGNAPLGSKCDYNPCDQFANYAVVVPYGYNSVTAETPCWGYCEPCQEALIPQSWSSDVSATKARLNWDPTGICDYSFEIRGKSINSNSWVTLNVSPSSPNFLDVTGLSNNTTYVWQIRSTCSSSQLPTITKWSKLDTFTTECKFPDSLWSFNPNSTSVVLNWNQVPASYGYQIQGGESSGSGYVDIILSSTKSSFLANGLKANTTYIWRMRSACNSSGSIASEFSPWYIFTTPPAKREIPERTVFISPNPVESKARIFAEAGSNSDSHLEVYNLAGRLVKEINFTKGDIIEFDASEFPSGVYHIVLTFENSMKRGKFLKL
ncbi:MAG: family 16 glycosylhydrolase [Chitinophagales bacterium]|nr:family 16 glycosylhydrolase [Chitinophagales bacterium]